MVFYGIGTAYHKAQAKNCFVLVRNQSTSWLRIRIFAAQAQVADMFRLHN